MLNLPICAGPEKKSDMTIAPKSLLSKKPAAAAIPIRILSKSQYKAGKAPLSSAQKKWIRAAGFDGEKHQTVAYPDEKGNKAGVLFGIGDAESLDVWSAAKLAEGLEAGRYRLDTKLGSKGTSDFLLGWCFAQYRFDGYKKERSEKVRILEVPENFNATRVRMIVDGVFLIRDLVNTPANDMGPSALAAAAKSLAKEFKANVTVTAGDQLLKDNFPAIHAVGRAAADAPRLIDLRWGNAKAPKVTLVGKGVCFDSGGLDIKSASGMRIMKKDMGGAAQALGLARMIMALKLPVRLRVLIPAVENSIAGNAYRPGDIIKTRKGLSVEITNTDAEGRLVLADALTLADEENPDLLLDFATLTGAARVALGGDLPALFTDDDVLAEKLLISGRDESDPMWRLPLWPDYEDDLKSPVADLLNAAENSFAGSITAALFLRNFVEQTKNWAHFDLYAWNQKNRPGRPQGGEAMTVRAVLHYLQAAFQ